jgi:hypothetical protein
MKFVVTFFLLNCLLLCNMYATDDGNNDSVSQNNDIVAQFSVNNPANVTCYAGPPGAAVAYNANNNNNYNQNNSNNFNNNGGRQNGWNGNNGGNSGSGQNGWNGNNSGSGNGGVNYNGGSNGNSQTVYMPVRVPKGMAQQISNYSAGGSGSGGGQVCSCPSAVQAAPSPVQSVFNAPMPGQGSFGMNYAPGMPSMGYGSGGMLPRAAMGMMSGGMMPGYSGGIPGFNLSGGAMLPSFGMSGGGMNYGGQGGNFNMGSMGGGISPNFQQMIKSIFSSGSSGFGFGGNYGGGNFGGNFGQNNSGADQYEDGNGYVCRKESGLGNLMNKLSPRNW